MSISSITCHPIDVSITQRWSGMVGNPYSCLSIVFFWVQVQLYESLIIYLLIQTLLWIPFGTMTFHSIVLGSKLCYVIMMTNCVQSESVPPKKRKNWKYDEFSHANRFIRDAFLWWWPCHLVDAILCFAWNCTMIYYFWYQLASIDKWKSQESCRRLLIWADIIDQTMIISW